MSEDLQRRSKTALACETCRRRKSRCDGRRPTCSHCVYVGAECHYRKLPSTVESDSALLARLAAVEARLDALDEPGHAPPLVASTHNSPASMQSVYDKMPEFHHGASHKILQYWSRLRVNLTIPDVEVLTFLRNTEDKALFVEPTPTETMKTTLPVSLATDCLRRWETHVSQLPVSFAMLLRTGGTWFSTDRIMALCDAQRFGDKFLHLNSLSVDESLIYAIAMRWAQDPLGPEVADFCFRMVLQRLWRVQMEADLVVVPALLVVAHLFLYAYAMPFQALAILQIIDPVLTRLFEAHDHLDLTIISFTQVFYVLQSDLLAEVDGLPSTRLPSLLPHSDLWPSDLISNVDDAPDAGFFVANLWLRSCLNRSLGKLFTTDQAYCQPRDAYPTISEMIVQLERWYRALPVELQFVRDARTFQLLMPPLSMRMKELSLRYHACIFVLNRPVLYSVLYQGIENSTTTPLDTAVELDRHLESRTIVACCDCIESAKLIILTLARHIDLPNQEGHVFFPARHNWCDIQLLVGSYAVLLSVQTAPSFSLHFRDITRIGDILDLAEEILSSVAPSSQGYATTLDILLNIRSNFQGTTPLTGVCT